LRVSIYFLLGFVYSKKSVVFDTARGDKLMLDIVSGTICQYNYNPMWEQVGGQNPVRGLCSSQLVTDILTKTSFLT
jgi:hypothetical protein